MRGTWLVLTATLFAVGVGVGRLSAPPAAHEDVASLASFVQALEDRDWLSRSHRMSAFLVRLGPDELPGALAALERRRAWLGQEEIRLFMLAWASFDPSAAFERGLAWPGRSQRTAAGAALYAWAFHDPDAALRALEAVEDEQLRDFLRTRLVAGWARGERRGSADRYIASLPEGAQRDSLVGMLARELNEQGPEAVMRWAEGVPELVPSYKQTVFRKACAALAATDPGAAVRWASTHAGRSYAKGSAAIIAGRWANLEPQAAFEWLLLLPRDEERDLAIADAFQQWQGFARASAERWLHAATPAEELDAAVRVVVRRKNREGSHAGAVEWAKRIHQAELRDEVIVALGRAWLRSEPAAAREWLARSDLSNAQLEAIREGNGPARVEPGGGRR